MANIQPFNYQESTNIEEHNQIVNKVNEIVEVINNVNLDTINSEIANLKTKATETDTEIANINNKDTMQDTEINGITKNLVSKVTASFDNPSRELKISLGREASPSIDATVVIPASSETGQYSAGNGITIQDYQIAVDTNVVALKTDIPVVPDVSELTQRVTTLETEMPTKVNIAQGVENAGKVLGIGSDGNVTPVTAGGGSGGGEVWEEVDLNNWPTDWTAGDRIKIMVNILIAGSATNWNTELIGLNYAADPTYKLGEVIELPPLSADAGNVGIIAKSRFVYSGSTPWYITLCIIRWMFNVDTFNSEGRSLIFSLVAFNGASVWYKDDLEINKDNVSTYITKMWRCRAST